MKKLKINHHSEMEVDLASLLAVMMKLVPVLLLSSAFIQMMVIETDLPQVVTEAIQKQDLEKKKNVLVEVTQDRKTQKKKIIIIKLVDKVILVQK